MADVKDQPTALADDASRDTDEPDRAELQPWSEDRIRNSEKWMERFIGAVRMPFEVDVQEYFERYGDE